MSMSNLFGGPLKYGRALAVTYTGSHIGSSMAAIVPTRCALRSAYKTTVQCLYAQMKTEILLKLTAQYAEVQYITKYYR